jgi:hypothetical protein
MNEIYVERAAKIVKQYMTEDRVEMEFAVRDILIELHHFCRENNIDFHNRLDEAEQGVQEELDNAALETDDNAD